MENPFSNVDISWAAVGVAIATIFVSLFARRLLPPDRQDRGRLPIIFLLASIGLRALAALADSGAYTDLVTGLKIAAAIRADGILDKMLRERYGSWDSGVGARIESGKESFASLEKYMLEKGDATPNTSGRQELIENIINMYV